MRVDLLNGLRLFLGIFKGTIFNLDCLGSVDEVRGQSQQHVSSHFIGVSAIVSGSILGIVSIRVRLVLG